MSDSDDDYMSEKLLNQCKNEDVRPGLLFNKNLKRKHEMYKKQRLKNPKSYQEQEKEIREKGLGTTISVDNKGFKMLEKMGYKAGTGLGKSGITEPVSIKIKKDAAGVGRDQYLRETIAKKETSFKNKEQEFRSSNAERRNLMLLHKDYKKAQRTCEELDLQSGIMSPQLPFFWSKKTLDSLKKKNEAKKEEQNEDDDSEEEQEDINEPKLRDMIIYLRRKYCYCMYCGDYIEETERSEMICPGFFRSDHDE